MTIKNIQPQDFSQLTEIYLQGIETGMATFQNDIPLWEDWDASHLQQCRIAGFENNQMIGWAALTPVSGRCVYAGVAEISIYVAAAFRGRGIGELLLTQLVKESEDAGLWTLQSGIFPENSASIHLHEKCGFRKIGYREKIGKKDNVWKDNVIMERRSKKVGI